MKTSAPPELTAHGGLLTQLGRNGDDYQPSNVTFSHLPPWDGKRLSKRTKYEAMAARALAALSAWMQEHALTPCLTEQELLIVPGLTVEPVSTEPTPGLEAPGAAATPG